MSERKLTCGRRGGYRTGLFSECSVRLDQIVAYVNRNKELPTHVDCTRMFKNFRAKGEAARDRSVEYFEDPQKINVDWVFNKKIDYVSGYQYVNYKGLDFEGLNPLVTKFFSPSEKVREIISLLEKKYSINYANLCVILYRGNDKKTETGTALYSDLFAKAEQYKTAHPNTTFLIQSDETEFLKEGEKRFSNSVVFYDEIKHTNSGLQIHKAHPSTKLLDSINYFAVTNVISKSKHIICGTGNCNIWPCLLRGNADGVTQYCHGFYKEFNIDGEHQHFGVYHWSPNRKMSVRWP